MKNKLITLITAILSISFVSADVVSDTNAKIAGFFTGMSGISFLNVIGWIIFILLIIGGGWWVYKYYKNKKEYYIRITAFKSSGGKWIPSIRDTAKVVKLGKGGFEILYLKKAKSWRISYGESVGINDYYFFIMPDGYWYNSVLLSGLSYMDKAGGLIPVATTNPLMRGQYTSLEKQIDAIHGQKEKWWDKYGNYVLSIAFVLIAGVLLWMMFKEFHSALGELSTYHTKLGEILTKLSNLATNIQGTGSNSGLTPA